ncbi:MAG: ATP synthase subunit I [Gammaproteobacteria bacterium]
MWIKISGVLAAAIVVLSLLFSGVNTLSAVVFGGGVAGLNVLLLRRCQQREKHKVRSAEKTLMALYLCVIQRFIAVTLLFYLGMGILNLAPLALLVGFIAGQLMLFMPELFKH